MAILTSNRVDFKTNSMTIDKEGYFRMIKECIYKEGMTTVNAYVPKNRNSKYTKQKSTELNREINKLIVIEILTPPLSAVDRIARQKSPVNTYKT